MPKLAIETNLNGLQSTLHPRQNSLITGNLAALNAEVVLGADGVNSVSIDVRGTYVGTIALQGTVDGTNWVLIPIRPITGGQYQIGVASAATGVFVAAVNGYQRVRAICTAYTSGTAIVSLLGSTALLDDRLIGESTICVTTTAAAGAAATLTLPAPGVGLRQYVAGIQIERFAAALLTAAATPTVITTTNLPGSLAFSVPADAAAQGVVSTIIREYSRAIAASAQNTAATIVAPVTTGVIWRLTSNYYVAP